MDWERMRRPARSAARREERERENGDGLRGTGTAVIEDSLLGCRPLPFPFPVPRSTLLPFPMNRRNDATQRRPPRRIRREHHRFLSPRHQVGAEDRLDPPRLRGLLELHRAIDAVGIGAGETGEPARRRRREQHLGTRDSLAEGEVGVDVEVGKHCGKGKGNGEQGTGNGEWERLSFRGSEATEESL